MQSRSYITVSIQEIPHPKVINPLINCQPYKNEELWGWRLKGPADTGHKLNIHKTSYVRSIYVLCLQGLTLALLNLYPLTKNLSILSIHS